MNFYKISGRAVLTSTALLAVSVTGHLSHAESPARVSADKFPEHTGIIRSGASLFSSTELAKEKPGPSSSNRAKPPADAVPVSLTGEVEVFYIDHTDHRPAEIQYFLKQKENNKRFRLQFEGGAPAGLRPGSSIKVNGKKSGETIFAPVIEQGAEDPGLTAAGALIAPKVSGEQRTVVLTTNFTDKPLSCSAEAIRDLVFTDPNGQSIDDYYRDSSHSNVWLSGEVHGTYTIPSPNDCGAPFSAYTDALDAAAMADGVDLSTFDRKVYVMPNTGCGYAGVGSVGNTPSQSLIFTCGIADVYAHELGHNFGMYHASTSNSEYGDKTGIMGISNVGLRHLNAAHQNEMGWRSSAMNVLVSESGAYDIAPQSLSEDQAVAPQILRVAKPDTSEYYFVAYRTPVGFDTNLEWWHHNIITVHRYQGAGGAPTNTFLVGELSAGDSFNDPVNSITITHLSQNADYATVQIAVDGAPVCSQGAPSVSMSPGSLTGAPGDTLSYSVSVTNTDSQDCSASNFSLSRSIPSGWSGSLSKSALSLAPGETGSATLVVSSAGSAAAGTYGLSVSVSNTAATSHAASVNASYVVADQCTVVAPTLSLAPGSQSGNPGALLTYSVTLVNNDSADCGSSSFDLSAALPQGWSGGVSPRQVDLLPGMSATASLSVASPATANGGSYGLSLNVSDPFQANHARSVTGSYTVHEPAPASDTEAPSVPVGLSANANHKQVGLSWSASSDNVGVTGYRVYRDGVRIASTTDVTYTDKAGADGTTYAYTVDAIDAAGNASAASAPLMTGKTAKGGGDSSTGGGGPGSKGKGPNK